MTPSEVSAALKTLIDEFFGAVSFETGERPAYPKIRGLFIDDGKLIRNSGELPEISSVDDFIAARERVFSSGVLTSFAEVEIAKTTEVFGNVAHRFSTYEKRGTMNGQAIEGAGLISTQFIRSPTRWMMTSMAWDDERRGLAIPDRYR
ncbi:MAG: hypothetical protein ACJ76Z_10330 [Thermoleophilaceae bacterium]